MMKTKDAIYDCALCGRRTWLVAPDDEAVTTVMVKYSLCYDCAFWERLALSRPDNEFVFGGSLYVMRESVRGQKADMIVVRDGKAIPVKQECLVRTTRVPEEFAPYVKDDRHFAVNKTTRLVRFLKDRKDCYERICYDRYNCLRYNLGMEKDRGPFNEVPKGWKNGGEGCPRYVPMDELGMTRDELESLIDEHSEPEDEEKTILE